MSLHPSPLNRSRTFMNIHFSPNQPSLVKYMMGKQGIHIREITRKVGNGTYIRFYSSRHEVNYRAPLSAIDRIRIESYSQDSIYQASKLLFSYRSKFKERQAVDSPLKYSSGTVNTHDPSKFSATSENLKLAQHANDSFVDISENCAHPSECPVTERTPEQFVYRIFCPYYLVSKVCGTNSYALKHIERQSGQDCFITYNNKHFIIQSSSGISFSRAIHSMRHRIKRCEKAFELEQEPESFAPFAAPQKVETKVRASVYHALADSTSGSSDEESVERAHHPQSIPLAQVTSAHQSSSLLKKAVHSGRAPTPVKSPELKLKGDWARMNGHAYEPPPTLRKVKVRALAHKKNTSIAPVSIGNPKKMLTLIPPSPTPKGNLTSSSPHPQRALSAPPPKSKSSGKTKDSQKKKKKKQNKDRKKTATKSSTTTTPSASSPQPKTTKSADTETEEKFEIEIPFVKRFSSPFWEDDSDEEEPKTTVRSSSSPPE